jgi:hypothetical protein
VKANVKNKFIYKTKLKHQFVSPNAHRSTQTEQWYRLNSELKTQMVKGCPVSYTIEAIVTLVKTPQSDNILKHTISQAVQNMLHWRQVNRFLESFSPSEAQMDDWSELKTNCNKLVFLWKNQLNITEMISQMRKI